MPAPRVVQSLLATALATSSLPITFVSSVGPQRCGLVFVVGIRVLGAPTFTLTDSRSQTWTEVATLTLDTNVRRISAFVAADLAEGPLTITVTPSAASDVTAVAIEIAAAARVAPITATVTASATSATPTATLTMPAEQHLALGAFTHLGAALSLGVGSGFSLVQEQENPATAPTLLTEAQAVTTPVVLTVDGTLSLPAVWALVAVLVQSLAVFVPPGLTVTAGAGGGFLPVPTGMG